MKRLGSGAGLSRCPFAGALLACLFLAGCTGGRGGPLLGGPPTTGTITTNLSDPATCAAPSGPFLHVWVTITRVRANVSASADPNASGWVDLVDLRSAPKQIDLLSLPSASCALTQLGLTSGIPPGTYPQVRVVLLSNTPAAGQATPAPNQCQGAGFNCVVRGDGSHTIQLSNEADTGIAILPGQMPGGAINLAVNLAASIDVDFNACASLVAQANGQFHLKPALHASEVFSATNGISGRVVDSSRPPNPIHSAIVILEQPDSRGLDRETFSGLAGSDGRFIFCPLPAGNFDVVVAAQTISAVMTTTFNPTVVFDVPSGASVGDIPLVSESPVGGISSLPAAFTGQITTVGLSGAPVSADVTLLPLLQATPIGGSPRQVTVPVFGSTGQPPTLGTQSGSGCRLGTHCATFALLVPPSGPQLGTFSSFGTVFSAPVVGNALYTLEAEALTCAPSILTSNQLPVTSGMTTTVNPSFTGCQ